jgi:AraC-like DNA-binding protein
MSLVASSRGGLAVDLLMLKRLHEAFGHSIVEAGTRDAAEPAQTVNRRDALQAALLAHRLDDRVEGVADVLGFAFTSKACKAR